MSLQLAVLESKYKQIMEDLQFMSMDMDREYI